MRAIDANLNRLGEGLRVLEEIARFYLNDASLTQSLRHLRHRLLAQAQALEPELLRSRDAADDVGAESSEEARKDLVSLARANARRAEESLRVLEEFARLPACGSLLDPVQLKEARFSLYDLEQELTLKLLRQEKRVRVKGLYVILDYEALRGRDEEQVAVGVLRGGASLLQLRDKARPKGVLVPIARRLKELCSSFGALFIVNDHLDLALASGADGLHLGQQDLPLAWVRRNAPLDLLVGQSCATLEEARRAQEEEADYIAVGSIFPTASKAVIRLAGLDTLRQVKGMAAVPVVAIGGIQRENLSQVLEAGADAVAVISAVLGAPDIEAAARTLADRMKGKRPHG